ncbi:hypothetical protein [Fluviicola sp.]|uniref:hypothetical protein n=1 Tax=Fluviicola sp. TaxID=1917219 RepID=UPI0031E18774
MRITVLLIAIFCSFSSFSQDDHFRVLFAANLGRVTMTNNEMVPPTMGYYNQSWNEDEVTYGNNFSTETKAYTCNTFMGQIGISVPFAKIGRVSFGAEPKFGIGILRSNERVNWNTLEAHKQVSTLVMDLSGLLYVRCKLWELFHVSVLGGYRLVRSEYNYNTPVFGLEFGMDYFRIGVYGYLTQLHFDRELSNGTTYPIRTFSDFGSISFYYTMGKRWFDKEK